jgi:hypothetical protein
MLESNCPEKIPQKNKSVLFQHKLNGRLNEAGNAHALIKDVENDEESNLTKIFKDEYVKTIKAAKYLFREFLEYVIVQGLYHPLPLKYPIEKLEEAYSKSDFDWQDKAQFDEFYNWFSANN